MEKLGKTEDIKSIKNYFTETSMILAYVVPLLLAAIYFCIHLPIQYYLIKYLPSIDVVKILSMGLYFSVFPSMAIATCNAMNKQIEIVFLTLPILFVNFLVNYLFLQYGFGIKGVALGTSISYFFYTTALIYYTFKQYKYTIKKYIFFLLAIYAPFICMILLIYLIETFIVLEQKNFWADVKTTSLTLGIFYLCYCPIFFFIRKHSSFKKLYSSMPKINVIRKREKIF
jgi:Na+-driven multidrug efflux pump